MPSRRTSARTRPRPLAETPLTDASARHTIRTALDRNILVEASAGSGKTYSLAQRMAAGIASGLYTVDQIAAVTFTRKAAAELRGRFQRALEVQALDEVDSVVRARLRDALSGLERLFAGTIHAFCARLLRERPVDAGLAPGFTEMDEVENDARRREAWRDFIARECASGSMRLAHLLETGLRPGDLDEAFRKISLFEEVAFPAVAVPCPDIERGWAELEQLAAGLRALGPERIPHDTGCDTLARLRRTLWRLAHARRERGAELIEALGLWTSHPKFLQREWHPDTKEKKRRKEEAERLILDFQQAVVEPYLARWREFVYHRAVELLVAGREHARSQRQREQTLNYEDLLQSAARLLRERPDVRAAMRRKYGRLFVDEFQDTDPVQAEVIMLLTADEPASGGQVGLNWRTVRPAPGALFVVGDPKQSIYRFRRADIEVYNWVRRIILENGGEVVQLTTSFRSRRELCDWTNTVFDGPFGPESTAQQPLFSRLVSASPDQLPAGEAVQTLTIPGAVDRRDVPAEEARRLAWFIRSQIDGGQMTAGDFLVLTRKTRNLAVYAAALEGAQVPVEVSGAGAFGTSEHVTLLAALLRGLADPDDGVSIVGVMRGPLFGVSDEALYDWRARGGRFRLGWTGQTLNGTGGNASTGPGTAAAAALEQMNAWYRMTREYPVPVALELILEGSGFLAWVASAAPGGAAAGDLLQAVDRARQVAHQGGSVADLADALQDEIDAADTESRCLEPGRADVVRVMNLHKAKGLEAKVVFLVDAPHGVSPRVDLRIDRSGAYPQGFLKIVRPRKDDTQKRQPDVLALPVDWDDHERTEVAFLEAEEVRLRYVAATRAKHLLVVCRWEGTDRWTHKAWGDFEPHLGGAPELHVPAVAPAYTPAEFDLAAETRWALASARGARLELARRPSFAITSVGARVRTGVGLPAAAPVPAGMDDEGPLVGGAAWGTVLHGLLEYAMRHPTATRDDLARLAQWLTVEHGQLRPFVHEALDWVDDVRRMPFWGEALSGGERLVEVPFAVRTPGPIPTILRGIVDLVYRASDGWHVIDYKTDRLDGVADIDAELRARHGAQLGEYADAWQRATGQRVVGRNVVSLRTGRIVPL